MPDLFEGVEPLRHDHGCKRLLRWPADTQTTAEFGGEGGCYRWELRQVWNPDLPLVMFLLMNPSGASIKFGDSTLLRTGGFARRWGYGGQLIGNVCAWRQRDNGELLKVSDPVGPENAAYLLRMASEAKLIIIGHGQLPTGLQRHADAAVAQLRAAGHTLHILRLSKDGIPFHPLSRGKGRLPDDAKPMLWEKSN